MELKRILTEWQTSLEGKAWNSIFWGNHDQPRAVSRFGNDAPEYRELSAKMLATCLLSLQGTPYIYQGDELGMTNAYMDDIKSYRDIESIHCFSEFTEAGMISEDEMMECLKLRSRDNARTPMQWDDSENAGFSAYKPWIDVNPNYREINVKAEMSDMNSVFHYYRRMIAIRKQYAVMVYGSYQLLLPENEDVYAYSRTLGDEKIFVLCNFSSKELSVTIPKEFAREKGEVLISNYDRKEAGLTNLRPYEAIVLHYDNMC
jgi:oligo-1,6-glucosidase